MKIGTTFGFFVLTILGMLNQAPAQEIAICGVGQIDENWIESLELEKNSEINLHIDYINRVCKLDEKQLGKLKIAAKMVVGRIVQKAKEQQQGMIEPGFMPVVPAIEEPVEEPVDESELGVDDEASDSEEADEPAATETNLVVEARMAAPAVVAAPVQLNAVQMVARDEFSDEEYLYGRSLAYYPLWNKKVEKILTEEQQELLATAEKERFQKTYQSVIERSVSRLGNVLFLNDEQMEKFTKLCETKLEKQISTEFSDMGQVYDFDGMLYSTTTVDDVAEILTEAQLERWKVITRHWGVPAPMVEMQMDVPENIEVDE